MISDDELERLEDDYVAAARLAVEAGFRAIDIKVTHGYLLSEMTGAKTREGRYGGSLENRLRFIRQRDRQNSRGVRQPAAALHAAGLLRRRAVLPRAPIGVGVPCDYPDTLSLRVGRGRRRSAARRS